MSARNSGMLLLVLAVVAASAVEIGRPALHNKLNARKMQLGESVATQVQAEQLAHLRVVAEERETSLADKFAADLEAHVTAKEAATESGADELFGVSMGAADTNAAVHSMMESLTALEYKLPKSKLIVNGANPKALNSKKTKWSSCLANDNKAVGVTTLKTVAFRSAPPLRDQSFVVNIDGQYKGPNVEYGSVTLQIAREEKEGLVLVYRHSIVLSDVLQHAFGKPFRAGDPFTASMYVPSDAFNLMAKEGDHVLTVVFTNQDKKPFACAELNFNLA